jgi:hypothetical protein
MSDKSTPRVRPPVFISAPDDKGKLITVIGTTRFAQGSTTSFAAK